MTDRFMFSGFFLRWLKGQFAEEQEYGMHPGWRGASPNGSDFLSTTGELRWELQPATLVTPNIWNTPG